MRIREEMSELKTVDSNYFSFSFSFLFYFPLFFILELRVRVSVMSHCHKPSHIT